MRNAGRRLQPGGHAICACRLRSDGQPGSRL